MKKKLAELCTATAIILAGFGMTVEAETIVFVPQDNRPVSLAYTVATAESAGYDILTPPAYLISGKNFFGYPDEIWRWLEKAAPQADVLVLSTDTLIYGGLVDSRKHNISSAVLQQRLALLKTLKGKYPAVPIYAFGTIMRSPRASGGGVEPPYYAQYGPTIFQIAALQDKLDHEGLSVDEQAQLFGLTATVPVEYLQDWFARRQKNMMVNRALIDYVKDGMFSYFALGHDDTSVTSQSAMESRYLDQYSKGLDIDRYGSFPGADQLGLLLIARAHVDLHQLAPTFQVIYPLGGAEKTLPHYENQAVGKTIQEHIEAVGGRIVEGVRPEYLLAVNSPLTKTTGESESFNNMPFTSDSTERFLNRIESAIKAGVSVSVADIAYSNGSDNIMTAGLQRRGLLYEISAYNGWNTASNTVGYSVAQSILSSKMDKAAHDRVLTQQYLDNWGYQANVRKEVYRMQESIRTDNVRYTGELTPQIREHMQELMQTFAEEGLGVNPRTISVTFPWGRLFEVDVMVHPQPIIPLQKEIRLAREAEEAKKRAEEEKKRLAEEKMKKEQEAAQKVSQQQVTTEQEKKQLQ